MIITRYIGFATLLATASVNGELVVYEGFDNNAGDPIWDLNGGSGWNGAWLGTDTDANGRGIPAVGEGLSFSRLNSSGGSYVRPQRYGVSESSRSVSEESQAALTADGSTIWFSVLMKANPGGSTGGYAANSHAAIVFGDASLTTANPATTPPAIATGGNAVGLSFDGDGSATSAIGIHGVTYTAGVLTADSVDGRIVVGDSTVLIVGKIEWAEVGSDDVMSLYRVADAAAELPEAFSVMAVDLDQSVFDIVAIAGGQTEIFDEIRMGSSVEDVLPLDTVTPFPNPMSFATAPTAISDSEITMTASTAVSDNPVEYLFSNTTLATDSGWQASPTFTDTGLTPDTPYSYTVIARETSASLIETAPSNAATVWTFPEVTGDEILATVFAGRSVSGTTATITDFIVNGVQDPGSLTVDSVADSTITVLDLFDAADAQNHFAPRTSTNSAHWQVDVPLAVDAQPVVMGNVELNVRSFSSSGAWKTVAQGNGLQEHYITLELFDSSEASLGSEQILATENFQYDWKAVFTTFDGIELAAGESYTLNILVSGPDPANPANAGNYVGLDSIRVLTESASGSSFADWQESYFPGENDEAIVGPNADPDSDGIDNLAEYGLNSDPTDPSDQPAIVVSTDETELSISYPTVAAATDISYTVEWSTNLEDWFTAGVVEVLEPDPAVDSDYPVIKAILAKDTDKVKFMRVSIEQL
ncbi:hypothetical protein [Roseibacillus persicicus]|uniref:hypothetical protein n=1 Tax=Roseibacillus persicicus TaxID=454148 RepID=UPI00280D6A21|nr:hypothetical protein [Roseibacillus persicicus]MDQ8190969.1 hypothetical protein [Roseibacillus persicicus]